MGKVTRSKAKRYETFLTLKLDTEYLEKQVQRNSSKPVSRNRRRILKWGASAVGIAIFSGIYWPNRWKYIVIHHSAGNYGDIEFLQEVHRQRQSGDPIDAIPYHYVIGNGNGLGLGEVASDWRKENNIWGAHVSTRNSDRNFRGLGICLIGDFEKQTIPEAQYQTLLTLVRKLQLEHNISLDDISGHGLTKGEMTLCPGKYFPMERLMRELSS